MKSKKKRAPTVLELQRLAVRCYGPGTKVWIESEANGFRMHEPWKAVVFDYLRAGKILLYRFRTRDDAKSVLFAALEAVSRSKLR